MRSIPVVLSDARMLLASVLFVGAISGSAQQFGFTQYTPKEGLAQSQVRCIAQDAEGYLWFGTLGGVSRFDGHTFVNYALQEGLPDAQVNAVLCAKDGTVWLGAGGSLMAFWGEQTSIIELPGEARDARILALAEDADGGILIGTDGSGLFRASGGNVALLPGFPSDTASTVRALLMGRDGEIIIGTRSGAYRWKDGQARSVVLGAGPRSISALALAKDGTVWYGIRRGERTDAEQRPQLACRPA